MGDGRPVPEPAISFPYRLCEADPKPLIDEGCALRASFAAMRRMTISGVIVALLASMVIGVDGRQLFAQSQTSPKGMSEQATPKAQPPGSVKPDLPTEQRIVTLIFSTLIALNQANATGNYTVFRELGAPGFQAANSAARLSEIFKDLRSRNFDLSPILLLKVHLHRKPEIEANGMLRVTGYFPTRPERLNFDLIFQPVRGEWRLFGIAANTSLRQPPSTTQVESQALATAKGVKGSAAAPSGEKIAPPPPKPGLPDIRNRVDEIEAASNASVAPPKPDGDNPFNPSFLKSLR